MLAGWVVLSEADQPVSLCTTQKAWNAIECIAQSTALRQLVEVQTQDC